jgi:hypothetical protein
MKSRGRRLRSERRKRALARRFDRWEDRMLARRGGILAIYDATPPGLLTLQELRARTIRADSRR